MTYLLYKCQVCDTVFKGAESDLSTKEVIHGIQEGWYDTTRLHSCDDEGLRFGIANLAGVEQS